MHNPRRKSVRAAMERHLSHQNPKKIERRFLSFGVGIPFAEQWVLQGIPHAERVVRVDGLRHLEEALSGGGHDPRFRALRARTADQARPGDRRLAATAGRRAGKERQSGPADRLEDLPVTLNLRPHFAALQENKPLIILVDGLVSTSLSRIPVRGISVNFAPGAMRIACAAGAPARLPSSSTRAR